MVAGEGWSFLDIASEFGVPGSESRAQGSRFKGLGRKGSTQRCEAQRSQFMNHGLDLMFMLSISFMA